MQQSPAGAAQEPTKQQLPSHSAVSEGHAQSNADAEQLFDEHTASQTVYAHRSLYAAITVADAQPGWSRLHPAAAAEGVTPATATAQEQEEQQTPSTQAVQQACRLLKQKGSPSCQAVQLI